jgi:hypothetical protein
MYSTSLETRPLSSWSTSPVTAKDFAMGDYAVRFMSEFPVESVLAIPFTGVGCYEEQEFVMLGGSYFVYGERLN